MGKGGDVEGTAGPLRDRTCPPISQVGGAEGRARLGHPGPCLGGGGGGGGGKQAISNKEVGTGPGRSAGLQDQSGARQGRWWGVGDELPWRPCPMPPPSGTPASPADAHRQE